MYSQQQHGMGALPMDEKEYKKIPLASTAGMGTLPSSKDLSEWFPVPGNQGRQGSCVAWSVGYGLKSYQEAVERKQKPTDANSTYSPSYIYNQIKLGTCTTGGSYVYQAMEMLKTEGTCKMIDFPYNEDVCDLVPNQNIKSKASNFRIADFRTVDTKNDMAVKSQLSSNFPIVILMPIDTGFSNLRYNEIYNGPNGQNEGFHAMVVVGYDDSRSAYKLLNSWGTNWGTNGYAWISYSAFRNLVTEAYTAQDIVIQNLDGINTDPSPSNNIPQPNSLPNTDLSITLMQPSITHNFWQWNGTNQVIGMLISVPGTIYNGQNSNGQLVVRFYKSDGSPLLANPSEYIYRDINGLVAAGSLVMPIINNPANLGGITLFIPYYALNFPSSNGSASHNVSAIATFYINNFEKAKSNLTPMIIRF